MNILRHLIWYNRGLAMMLILSALAIRVLVPAGYMIPAESRIFTVSICSQMLNADETRQIAIPMKGHDQNKSHTDSHTDLGTCAFSSLSGGALTGADPALLLAALTFILLLGLAPLMAPLLELQGHLRPPLRGPPLAA